MITSGYGVAGPNNIPELWATLFCIAIGAFLAAIEQGLFTTALLEAESSQSQYESLRETLDRYLRASGRGIGSSLTFAPAAKSQLPRQRTSPDPALPDPGRVFEGSLLSSPPLLPAAAGQGGAAGAARADPREHPLPRKNQQGKDRPGDRESGWAGLQGV